MNEPPGPSELPLRRLGYHDFLAYAELVSGGKYQGFVRVRHHLLCGSRHAVFRAGPALMSLPDALEQAQLKIDALIRLLGDGRLPLKQPHEGRGSKGHDFVAVQYSRYSSV